MVTNGKFFISCCDASAFFEVSEQAFDGVAFFVRLAINGLRISLLVRFVRDDRRDAAFAQAVAIVVRRAAFVAGHLLRSLANTARRRADRYLIHRRQDQRIVARLTATHQRCQWQRMMVTHRYELGREAAFRLADSVVLRLAFDFFSSRRPPTTCGLGRSGHRRKTATNRLCRPRGNESAVFQGSCPMCRRSCCQSRYRAYSDPHWPYRCGMSRQGTPVLRHHKMPLIVRRRSCILRPRPLGNSGRQGSNTSHCKSLNSWRSSIPSFLNLNAIVSIIPNLL